MHHPLVAGLQGAVNLQQQHTECEPFVVPTTLVTATEPFIPMSGEQADKLFTASA